VEALTLLRGYVDKRVHSLFTEAFLQQLFKAAAAVTCFSDSQKYDLFKAASISCPLTPVQKMTRAANLVAVAPYPTALAGMVELFLQILVKYRGATVSFASLQEVSMSQAAMIEMLRFHQAADRLLPKSSPAIAVARIFI